MATATFLQRIFKWVALLCERGLAYAQTVGLLPARDQSGDPYAGAYISDNEVAVMLRVLRGVRDSALPDSVTGFDAEIESTRLGLHQSLATEAEDDLVARRLAKLQASLRLSSQEVELLLVALAPALDIRFARLYAYIQNDIARKDADITLLLLLLNLPTAGPGSYRSLLSPDRTLRWYYLVTVEPPAGFPDAPLLRHRVVAAERVVSFLLDQPWRDESILSFAEDVVPSDFADEVCRIYAPARRILAESLRQPNDSSTVVLIKGPTYGDQELVAEAYGRARDKRLLVLDAGRMPIDLGDFDRALREALREAILSDRVVFIKRIERLSEPADRAAARWQSLRSMLERLDLGVVFLSSAVDASVPIEDIRELLAYELPMPPSSIRMRIWAKALAGKETTSDLFVDELAERFPICGVGIRRAASIAERRNATITPSELHKAIQEHSSHRLNTIATRIQQNSLRWEDLIVADDIREELLMLTMYARFSWLVYQEWGFAKRIPYGRGLTALFSGGPGTGKTMAANILGNELQQDVYRVDVSRVVSKWVGETEKNLARVFDEAESANVILLFDEADSLFGKRSEVKQATDRYANLEINYLLQRMESYQGIAILTSNLEGQIDKAFLRRFQFLVRFPMPSPLEREQIWRSLLPSEELLAYDVDLAKLAQTYELSGGHIKNALLRAAFAACSQGNMEPKRARTQRITQASLRLGIESELAKLGKLI